MLLPFLLRLLAGAVFPLVLLSLLSAPVFGVVPLTWPTRTPGPWLLSLAAVVGRTLVQLYVWVGWAAYCAVLALRYTSDPLVDEPWLYVALAFFAVNLPITFLALREQPDNHSDEEREALRRGTIAYRLITILAFTSFLTTPQLLRSSYGWLVERVVPTEDRIEVRRWLRDAALGDANAQYQLGVAYTTGRVVGRDPREAERWHLAAAQQDHLGSQSALCRGHVPGGRLREDFDTAADWCRQAADRGDPQSSLELANLYAGGQGVAPDRAEATRWYRSAAEGGVPAAQVILGRDLADDDHVSVDLVEAYQWLTIATANRPAPDDLGDVLALRERVRDRLTPSQVAMATRLAREWRPRPTGDLH